MLEQPTTNTYSGNDNHMESNLADKHASDVNRKSLDGAPAGSNSNQR